MRLDARFNLMLHLCVVLGATAFCVADGKLLLGLLAMGATVTSYLITRGRRAGKPPLLPRAAINVLVFAASVNAAMRASGNNVNEEFVSTLGQFLVFIVVIKLLDRRGARDDAQLMTLTIFIAVAAVLTAGSLPVGLLLIAYVPMVVATSMMWQIHSGLVAAVAANAPSGREDAGLLTPPVVAVGRRPRRAFVSVCATAVLASSAIATAVFVLVPRGFGNDLLGRFGMQQQAQIGFRESVKLGESGFLSENPTPVMDVLVTTATGEALGGSGETLYLRGAARDEYNPILHVWDDPSTAREIDGMSTIIKFQEGYEYFLTIRYTIPHGGEVSGSLPTAQRKLKITMRGESLAGVMFSAWRPLSVTPDRTVDARVSPRNGTMHTQGAGRLFTYTIKYSLADEMSWPPHAPTDFQDGRIHDLASGVLTQRGLVAGPGTSRQMVTAIRDHLRTSYAYTLEMVAPPGEQDPIEFFLFDRKKGHCEYFASAMAAMCQSQGIPCRVVTGYLATEYNSLTGQYLVRESNAHAWVEAFIVSDAARGDGRWETFDASPPGDIDRIHRPAGGVLASLRRWYDTLEFGWSSSVIGYDNSKQRAQTPSVLPDSAFVRRFDAEADRFAAWIKTMRQDPKLIPLWVKYSPVMPLLMVGIWVAFRARVKVWVGARRHTSARASFGITPFRATGFYARTLKALERAGVPKPDQTPPGLFAQTLETRSPEAAATLRSIAATFYRSHFGGKQLDAAEVVAVTAQVQRLEAVLKKSGVGR